MQAQGQSNEEVGIPWARFRVPPFPQTALRVLELVNDECASMHHLSDLISSDPAFSSELLIIANSALLAHRIPVTSVPQAIALLGTHSLKGVCLTVGARAYLGKSINHPSLRAIWRHGLACALVAEKLARASLMDRDMAYTAGILHEIGRFALAVLRPVEYATLLETHNGTSATMLQNERELFGFDHCDAGLHLVSEWKLPVEFEAIVCHEDCPFQSSDPWHMSGLIHMSCRMADTAGFAAFPGCEVTPYEELLYEFPFRERSFFHPDIKDLAAGIGTRINALECL